MQYPDDDEIIKSALFRRFAELECCYSRYYRACEDTQALTVAGLCYDIARILKDRYDVEMIVCSDSLRSYIERRFVEDSSLESVCDDFLFNSEFD